MGLSFPESGTGGGSGKTQRSRWIPVDGAEGTILETQGVYCYGKVSEKAYWEMMSIYLDLLFFYVFYLIYNILLYPLINTAAYNP